MKATLKTALVIILAFSMLVSAVPAFAEETAATESTAPAEGTAESGEADEAGAPAETTIERPSILDEQKIQMLADNLMETHGITGDRKENVSIVYTYLATGDSWYYNADTWRYPASMYKVPMMMVLAERVAKGELTQDADIGGMTLTETEDLVLIWSNNEQAHVVRKYLGGDPVARKLYQVYSPLEESYYHSDFIDYCYFTARYMDDVMQTLYNDQSNFPYIMDCLKVAMPERYYHLNIDPSYVVAQKYGTFKEFNNNTGIIFTPNPFILTVMTEHMSVEASEAFMGDAAKVFLDYTLTLDGELAAHEQMIAEQEAKAAEEARLAKEEAERKAREAAEAAAQAERERVAEIERAQKEAEAQARKEKLIDIGIKVLAVGAVVAVALFILVRSYKKKRRAEEEAYEKEMLRRRRYGIDAPDFPGYDESHDFADRSRSGRRQPAPRQSSFEEEFAPRRRSQELTERYTKPQREKAAQRPARRSRSEYEDEYAIPGRAHYEKPSTEYGYDEFDESSYRRSESRPSRKKSSDKGGYKPKH